MNKHIIKLILLYILIFAVIFTLVPKGGEQREGSVRGFFRNMGNSISRTMDRVNLSSNFRQVGKGIEDFFSAENFVKKSCKFSEDFECKEFTPYPESGKIYIELINKGGMNVLIKSIEFSGGIDCNASVDKIVYHQQPFSHGVSDCKFNGTESKLKVSYKLGKEGKSLMHESVGEIIYK